VFERFTERARQVVVLAQDEARVLKHNYIGTEHLLLGLLREEDGVAAHVLKAFEITADSVRVQVAEIVGEGDEAVTGQIPFTPLAKKALELSLREALHLGHSYIGTEHILLGVARETNGVAARILLDFDAEPEKIRDEVSATLGIDAAALARTSKGRRFRRPRPVGMMTQPCWQYRIERRERVEAHVLNDLGDEGWELVSVHPVADWVELIFKRRRMSGELRAAG